MTNRTDSTGGTDNSTEPSAKYGGFVFGESDGADEGSDGEASDADASSEPTIAVRTTIATAITLLVVLAVVLVVLGQVSGGGDLLGGSPAGVEDGTNEVLRGVATSDVTDTASVTAVSRQGDGSTAADTLDARTSRAGGTSQSSRAGEDSTGAGGEDSTGAGGEDSTGAGSETGRIVASSSSPTRNSPTTDDTTVFVPSTTDRLTIEPRASGEDTTMASDTATANSGETGSPATVTPGERSPSIETVTVTRRNTGDGNATVVLVIDWRVSDPDGDLEAVRVSLRDGDGATRRVVDRTAIAVGGSNASGDTTFAVDGSSETPYEIAIVAEDRTGATALRIERAVADGDDG